MLPHPLARLCEIAARGVRAYLVAPLAAGLLALSACGDGGGIIGRDDDDDGGPPSQCTASTCGQVVIGLTDADGDFLSYAVDVVSIELERANGDTVETLPTEQRVDFADLVDVTEFVTAATIPNGTYVAATIRLDYTEADVTVEVAGLPAAAVVVDENGQALGEVDLELTLDNANHVVIAPGVPALLQLDFDLAATHDVDITSVPAIAIADPFLIASIEPVDAREFRVRGPLVSVDEAEGLYVIDLRPFNHPNARHGELTVLTTADTAFEVDGEELDQAAALAAMADLGAGTATVAHGVFDVEDRTFTADRVLAGDSVPGARFDVVIGNVMARDGDTLIVRGGTVIRADEEDEDRTVFARGDITVELGPNTGVFKDGGSDTALDIDDISVGQRITALGEVDNDEVSPTLDADPGRVRLHLTHVSGEVVNAIAGQLDLDLFAIDGRDPAAFDFSGTGGSSFSDADPDDYEIDTGTLDTTDFEDGDPARAFGFMTPFGEAPPDFEGRTLVDFEELRALLGIGYGFGGTDAPFLSMNDTELVLDNANPDLGFRRFLKVGGRIIDITTLGAPITIEPAATGRTVFVIARFRRAEVFADFKPFQDELARVLGGGSLMLSLTARGTFDVDDTTVTANFVAVTVRAP